MRKTLSAILACLVIAAVVAAAMIVSSSTKDAEAFIIDYDDPGVSGGDVIASPGGCAGPVAPCTQSVATFDSGEEVE
jgi:predicted secreted Zn-dependent protease